MSGFTESVVEQAALAWLEALVWGTKVIDRLAADIRAAFPETKGFSSSNLKYMRFFAEKCPPGLSGQQPADQFRWFPLVTLHTKVSADSLADLRDTLLPKLISGELRVKNTEASIKEVTV